MSFRFSRGLYCIACAIPFITLIAYLWQYTVNAPYYDDFIWGLDLIDKIKASRSFTGTFTTLFSFHNDHRIAWAHTIIYLQYLIYNQLDFRLLIFIGNIPLFISPFFFWKPLSKYPLDIRLGVFLSILLIVWQPQCYHNFFTTYNLTNHYIIFFILLLSYLLIYHPSYFFLSILVAFVCTFTSGIGIAAWILGASVLLIKHSRNKCLIWGLCAAVSSYAYFFVGVSKLHSEVTNSMPSFGTRIVNFVFYLPTFCFDLVEFGQFGGVTTRFFAMGLGFIFFVVIVFWAKKNYQAISQRWLFLSKKNTISNDHLFLGHIILWVLIAGLAAAIKRTGAHLFDWVIPDHYRIYSQLFIICLLILSIPFWYKPFHKIVLSGVILFYVLSYYVNTPRIVNLANNLRADAHNYATGKHWVLFPSYIQEAYYLNVEKISQKTIPQKIWIPKQLSQIELRTLEKPKVKSITLEKGWQTIDIQYFTPPNTDFILYQTTFGRQLVLPLQMRYASPLYLLKNRRLTQSAPKSVTNQWYWKHFDKTYN